MTEEIKIYEAASQEDVAFFWEQLRISMTRDFLPDPEDERRAYFLDDTRYRAAIEKVHQRSQDRCYYLLFYKGDTKIGYAQAVIYHTEDGKCFLMNFCVFPQFRGHGTGHRCARVFLAWAYAHGGEYVELNCDTQQRMRFWHRVGFRRNGTDPWGVPLMLLPPTKPHPITVELLEDVRDWQLYQLTNGYLSELGKEPIDERAQERLSLFIEQGKFVYFLAKRGYRAIGMCQMKRMHFTTTAKPMYALESLYVSPVFRKCGTAKKLLTAIYQWGSEKGVKVQLIEKDSIHNGINE